MVYIAAGLIVVVALLVVALYRLQHDHILHIERLLTRENMERQVLIDRIQHPEVRHVDPVEWPDVVPPRDAAELAMVGQMVPEFVHVGDPNSSHNS